MGSTDCAVSRALLILLGGETSSGDNIIARGSVLGAVSAARLSSPIGGSSASP